MKVIVDGDEIDLGTVEAQPTISIIDYSRRETDDYGVTTVVERGFARRMSVRLAVPFEQADALQRQLAELRATPAQWVAAESIAWLNFEGFYKNFEIDLAVPPMSYCTLTVEGLAETEAGADDGSDPAPAGSASTLRLLQPVNVTDAELTAGNVSENDHAEWLVGTTYALGARVIKAAQHRIYESLRAGNLGHDPAAATGEWLDIGPTNRWAMFDQALGTATTAPAAIGVVLDSSDINAIALLDVAAATVRVQAAGYDQTKGVGNGAVLFLDLPATDDAITVTIAGPGTVAVGTLLIGTLVSLGVTEASPTAGISDFSRKETDEFGEVTVVPRAWAKRMTARAMLSSAAVDLVANRIAAVRAQPSLWIAREGTDSLTVYGFFKEFSIEVGIAVSTLSLSIEGLSEASARGALIGSVNWPDVIDSDPVGHPKPEDGATVGAPPGTPVGNRPAEDVVADLDAAASALAAAQSDITALQALGASLGDLADDLADSIGGLYDDVVALGTDISTLYSITSTQGSQITTQGTAISGLAGSVATLTTKVSAGAINMVRNSTFENGLTNWTQLSGVWSVLSSSAWGPYAYTTSVGYGALVSDFIPVDALSTYTASADLDFYSAAGGVLHLCISWFNAGGEFIDQTPVSAKALNTGFTATRDGRIKNSGQAPAGATHAQVVIQGNVITSGSLAVRQVKLEMGTEMSNYTQEASVAQTFTALSTLNTQYASLSSTVATQGSSISSNAAAITTINTNVATLTTKVSAGAQNLLKNGNFEMPFSGYWTPAYGSWAIYNDHYGRYAHSGSAGLIQLYSEPIAAQASLTYTASANMHFTASDGIFFIFIAFYDSSNNHIGSSAGGHKTLGQYFTTNADGRVRDTGVAPASTSYARVIIQGEGSTGAVSRAVKEVKFENGAVMSLYSQEASVFQSFQAISTLDGQMATVTSTVATQGSSIALNATAISGVAGDLATLSSTVSAQGSLISSQASALSTTNGNVASLTSTVSAQGASITSQSSAISTLNSNVATAFARYALRLDVNGYWIGWEINNNGSSGSVKFRTDLFELSSPSGGRRIAISGGIIYGYYASGNLAFRLG